ncbi:Retrovirus-related Pol polyprotein from transposon [Trichinella sp. T6]|nr:Retrovirus-related Pol polyprotein from transposon [Trichinella sp. T6]
MKIVAVELLRPAPRSKNGNSYIMVVTDYFTHWVEAYALPNQQAETVAPKLMQQFVCRFGTSMKLLSDQGTQFQGRLVPELCKGALRDSQWMQRSTRTLGNATTTSKYVEMLAAYLRNAFAAARKHSAEEQKRQRKVTTPWTRPFEIIKEVSGLNYRIRSIRNPRRTLLVHVNRLKPCELTSAQLCSLRQKYMEDKQQVRRDHQSKTKPRIYRPRLVWDEEDHGHDGTSTQAMVAQRPQRNRYPPVRYNDYIFY